MRRTFPRRFHGQGFTLLELLIVVSILSLIATASFGALRIGNRSFVAGVDRAAHTENVRAVSAVLRRQFGQLLRIVREVDGDMISSFIGSDEQLRFIAPAPQPGGGAGLFVFTISSRSAGQWHQLVLSHAVYDPGRDDFDYLPASRHLVLADSLTEVRFAYFGAADPEAPPEWHANWIAEDGAFPRKVRIDVDTVEGNPDWPNLLFRIPAGGRE